MNKSSHFDGCFLALLLTDASEAAILLPIGISDHGAISCEVRLYFEDPGIAISRQVFLKSRVNWDNIYCDNDNSHWDTIFLLWILFQIWIIVFRRLSTTECQLKYDLQNCL